MADVKWIKITTDVFDDEKILLIESMPDANAIIVVWFKLLCLAGKQNNSGVFMMNDKIAYTDKMLSTIFRMNEATVQMALKIFEQFGMIEIVDGVITIPNWGKHQSLDQLENKKEYMRNYMRDYREKQKQLTCKTNNKVNDKTNVSEADKERDKEREEDKDIKGNRIDYQKMIDLFHSLCPSFPTVKALSDARKKAIKARLKNFSIEEFENVFRKAEASDFLKGANDRNWTANFDWIIKDANMAKILDGNYDNKEKKVSGRKEIVPDWMNKNKFNNFEQRNYNMMDLEGKLLDASEKPEELSPEYKQRMEDLKRSLGVM